MTRYQITKELDRWIIVCARDPSLIWVGNHWAPRDRTGGHLVTFGDEATAAAYAREAFGEEEQAQ